MKPHHMKNVRKSGEGALAWLADNGWQVSSAAAPFLLHADVFSDSTIYIRRTWHSSGVLRATPALGSCVEGPAALLVLEGRGVASVGGRKLTLAAWDLLLFDPRAPFAIRADTTWATIQIGLRWECVIPRYLDSRLPLKISCDSGVGSILVSAASATVTSSLRPNEPACTFVARGLEGLLTGLVMRSDARISLLGDDLYRRAMLIIAESHTDPDLSVERLATLLRVSRRTIECVFATSGMPPGKTLRRFRLSTAQALESQGIHSRAEIAQLSGFRDLRSLRRALRSDP